MHIQIYWMGHFYDWLVYLNQSFIDINTWPDPIGQERQYPNLFVFLNQDQKIHLVLY